MRTVVQTPGLVLPEAIFAPFPPALFMDRRPPMDPPSRANLELLLNAIDDRTATRDTDGGTDDQVSDITVN